jgi:hypothetical protein
MARRAAGWATAARSTVRYAVCGDVDRRVWVIPLDQGVQAVPVRSEWVSTHSARYRELTGTNREKRANGRPSETGVHRPLKIRTSAVTCGNFRTSSPVTALPMIMR